MRYLPFVLLLSACNGAAIHAAQVQALSNPNDAQAWVDLGDAYAHGNHGKRALAAYQQALQVDPTNAAAVEAASKVPDRDLDKLQKAVLKTPENDEAWGDLADAESARGLKDAALQSYTHALTIDPRDSEWTKAVAAAEGPDAVFAITDVLIPWSDSDDEVIGDWADIRMNAGLRDEACALYDQALAIDPADNEWLGQVQTCNGDTGGGYVDGMEGGYPYGEVGGVVGGVVDGTDPSAYGGIIGMIGSGEGSTSTELAESLAMSGQREAAINSLWSSLQSDPADPYTRSLYVLLTGQSEVTMLERLTASITDNDELWGDLGDARLAAGDRAGAAEAFGQASSLDSSDREWQTKAALLAQYQ
jgi:tetratricopeptide (TPR) repeat protein